MTYAAGSAVAATDFNTIVGSTAALAANVLPSWANKHTSLNVFGDIVTRTNDGNVYGWASAKSNRGASIGKYYWEVTVESAAAVAGTNNIMIGVATAGALINTYIGATTTGLSFYNNGGGANVQKYYYNGTANTYGTGTFETGAVIGVLLDFTAGTLTFYKNGISQGALTLSSFAGLTGTLYPTVSLYSKGNSVSINLGQRDFVYSIPSGASVLAPTSVRQLGSFFGIGYGDWGYQQTSPALTAPIAGANIIASTWNNVSAAVKKCADHQGSSATLNPPITEFDVGDAIKAYTAPANTAYSFSRMIGTLSKTRHNAAAGAMTVYLPTTYGLRLTYSGASWGSGVTNGLRCVARYSFTNEEEARKFFNTGGELRISIAHPNTSTVQNSNWNALCAAVGTIKIGANSTVVTGSVGSSMGIGYYQCTTSIQTVFDGTNIGTGAYTANDLIVSITSINAPGTNGGRGYQLNVTVQLNDHHTNAFSDTVNNGTYADFGYYAATTYLTSPVPTVTQITAWATISV